MNSNMTKLANEYLDANMKVLSVKNAMWKECEGLKSFREKCVCGASPERSLVFDSYPGLSVKLCLDCGGTL